MQSIKTFNKQISHYSLLGLGALLISGCAAQQPPTISQPSATPISQPAPVPTQGLEGVLGLTANQLEGKFGAARLDVREANGRKLQFSGKACIMDVYLYAPRGQSSEVATHVDARRKDGAEVDRVSCVRALSK